MENKDLPDFKPIFKKIFTLTDNIRKFRKAFLFSKSDEKALKDRKFIMKWREIEKKNS